MLKGIIKAYSACVNSGVIKGDDGNNYQFTGQDWLDKESPRNNERVSFIAVKGWASRLQRDRLIT